MTRTKKMIALTATIATIGAGAIGSTVLAAQHVNGQQNGMSNLVNAIATKFHLSTTDVQAVVDQQRQQSMDAMKQQMATRRAASLAQAVKDGKLTQAQSDAITAKDTEIQAFEATLQGKTPADRQTAMKTEMDSVKVWETSNNIPAQYMMFGRGMGPGPGMGMSHGGFRGGMRGGAPGTSWTKPAAK